MSAARTAIYTLTRQGMELARQLAESLKATVFATRRHAGEQEIPFDSLPILVGETFAKFENHIFIAAAGIVVRCIAPHLKDKQTDPAVVCLDQAGRFSVSLLSGHLGGGNVLAEQCAEIVGGQAVITTATDTAGVPSMDMVAQEHGLVIGNIDRVKVVNGALLDGNKVQVYDPDGYLEIDRGPYFVLRSKGDWRQGKPGVWVSEKSDCTDEEALRLYPRSLMVGIGCRRGVSREEIGNHLLNVFTAAGLATESIAGIASVDVKSDEQGLLELADELCLEPIFHAREELDRVEAPNPSGAVMQRIGIASVSEAAAILSSDCGELLVEKTKTKTVTLAVARRKIC